MQNGKSKPWQPRWWQENPERWRWAATIALVFMLMGAFAYRNPEVWQNTLPAEEAAPEEQQMAGLEIEPGAAEAAPPEAVPPEAQLIESAHRIPEPEGPNPAAAATANPEPAASEPESPGDEVKAVIAPPSTWQPPALGEWTRDYGYGLDPTLADYRFHRGRDMELAEGAPVFAVAAGLVTHAADDSAWGGLIIIEHGGGWKSVYKCAKPVVKAKAEVFAGEQIGIILASPVTEKAQNSHLHFEMELDGESQDPSQWI